MVRKGIVALFVGCVLMLGACGGEEVSFDTLETARAQAKENAVWNAKAWRAQLYPEWDVVSRGDSTQVPECPQGDGWASIDLVSPGKSRVLKLKCSTVSSNIGCLEATDFKGKSFAQDEGKCQDVSKVPFPIPKIAQ